MPFGFKLQVYFIRFLHFCLFFYPPTLIHSQLFVFLQYNSSHGRVLFGLLFIHYSIHILMHTVDTYLATVGIRHHSHSLHSTHDLI